MKTHYFAFLLLGLCCSPFATVGQKDLKTVTLDFKTKKFENIESIEKLKTGNYYQLKIDSINMNLYKISILKEDTIIVPDVQLPTFDLVNLGGVGAILGKLAKSTISTIAPIRNDVNNVLNKEKGDVANRLNNVFWGKIQLDSLGREFTVLVEGIDLLKIQESDKVLVIKESVITYIGNDQKMLSTQLTTLKDLNKEIDNLTNLVQNVILSYNILNQNDASAILLKAGFKFEDFISESNKIRKEIKNVIKTLEEKRTAYNDFKSTKPVKEAIEKDEELKKLDKELIASYDTITSTAENIYESINAEKINKWLTAVINLENNKDFSYTSLPMRVNGNKTELKITIEPKKVDSGLPSYSTQIDFPLHRKTFVGVGASFYGAGFHDDVYSVKGEQIDSATTAYKIVKEKSSAEIGLTALLHLGWQPWVGKKADFIAFNFVVGPAISLTNPIKPRLAVGGGFAFGRKQMLTINGLAMFGQVEKRSASYDENTKYSGKPENITVARLSSAFGISVGYIYHF